jgi:hypothetical protein
MITPLLLFKLDPKMWSALWSLNIPPKIKSFWWKACHNALPTGETLFSRKLIANPICQRCRRAAETIEHIIFRCRKVAVIWENLSDLVKIPDLNVSSISQWTDAVAQSFPSTLATKVYLGKTLLIAWEVWNWTNKSLFEERSPTLQQVLYRISLSLM